MNHNETSAFGSLVGHPIETFCGKVDGRARSSGDLFPQLPC